MAEVSFDSHGFPEGRLVGLYSTRDTNVQAAAGVKPLGAPADEAFVENGVLEFDVDAGSYQLAAPVNGLFAGQVTNGSFVVVPRVRSTVRVELIDPEDGEVPLSVEVSGRVIEVTLSTDGDGDFTATAQSVVNAINGDTDAFALVEARVAEGSSGTGIAWPEVVETAGGAPGWRYVGVEVRDDG